MTSKLLQELPIDVVGNIILSFLSMNDLICFALINRQYYGLTNELYRYHMKPLILNQCKTFPKEIGSVLSAPQLWTLYEMFKQLSFTNNIVNENYWFQVELQPDSTYIAHPLLWFLFDVELNQKRGMFKYRQIYYPDIGLYDSITCRISKLPPSTSFGRINLSKIPSNIDTFVINMNHQHVVYYFDDNDDQQQTNTIEEKKDNKDDDNKIYLWKNICIAGGRFVDDTLDCYDIQKHIQLMYEKYIYGFDEMIYKMDHQLIQIMFNNNKLKVVKNMDKLHPFVGNLRITNQWNWNEPLKNIKLANYEQLNKINLSSNNLKGNIQDLAHCLPKGLKVLNMNCNSNICGCFDFKLLFYESGLKVIEEVIVTNCNLSDIKNFHSYLPQTLKILCLNYNNIEIDWNQEFQLTETLRKVCSLERLSLSHNKITGIIDLQDLCRWIPPSLYLIDLNSNNLSGNIHLKHFPDALEEFDISDNNTDSINIIDIELMEQNPHQFAGFTWNLDAQYI